MGTLADLAEQAYAADFDAVERVRLGIDARIELRCSGACESRRQGLAGWRAGHTRINSCVQ